ncbi:MAG: GNAT family N-acetyltransferase [Pseudomonadota bacterium]
MTFEIKPRIETFSGDHDVSSFDCGSNALNSFLKKYALTNQKTGSAKTYLALIGGSVVGFYSLTFGQVEFSDAPDRLKKGLPRHPIPIILLARLGIDKEWHGQGLGSGLLLDALRCTLQAADIAGTRAIVVHAKDEQACSSTSILDFRRSLGNT